MLEDIPVQDESDVSIRTRGRRTNRSSSSQLPKGSSGSTRRRASAGPATSLTRASEPRGPGQGGQESAVSAVDTLQASGRGSLQAYDRGDSNVGSDEESSGASGAVDLEPPPDERTSTGVTTGFGGPAAPPAVEGSGDATTRVGRRSSTRASTTRTSTAYTDTRVLPMQQRVRPARREPILILPTPVRVTRTAAQRRVPGFVIGRSPSKHSGNGRPPPTAVTMHDSPYDSEEEVDAWYAREVAVEYKDFVDEILEESPEAIPMTTDTSLAIGRDSNAISGGGSNANSGGGSGSVDSQQANSRDSNANSGGGSNANSGGRSNESDTQRAIDRDSNANSGGGSNGSDTRQAIGRDPNANSGGDSNANSGGESDVVDSQQANSRDSNAISGGESNANSGGQSATTASVPAA